MKEKKLLQIWDITCSSATLAEYLEDCGWRCKVIVREAFHKHSCSEEFWDYVRVPGGVGKFCFDVAKTILSFRPSIILVRQVYEILPLVRVIAPFTPLIMQFHGHEVRYCKTLPWQASLATKRISSTRDIERWGDYYGTPIHPMFKPPPSGVRKPGTALFIRINLGAKDCLQEAKAFAKDRDLELTVIDRTQGQQIPHIEMPGILQKYEWYLDLKGLTSQYVLSKTAIEFLHTTAPDAPGKVLADTGDIVTSFNTTQLSDYVEFLENFIS